MSVTAGTYTFKTTRAGHIEIQEISGLVYNACLVSKLKISTCSEPGRDLDIEVLDTRPIPNGITYKAGAASGRARWEIYVSFNVADDKPFINGKLTISQVAGDPLPVNTRFQIEISGDDGKAGRYPPRFLVPGVMYRENCPENCKRIYPKYVSDQVDLENFISPSWSFPADRVPAPAVWCWDQNVTVGLAPLWPEGPLQPGLGFSGKKDESPVVEFSYPSRHEPAHYSGFKTWRGGEIECKQYCSTDPKIDYCDVSDKNLDLDFIIHVDKHDLHGYRILQRELYDHYHQTHDLAPWMSKARASELTSYALHKYFYSPDERALLETVHFDSAYDLNEGLVDRPQMHISWVSGVPYALGMIEYGSRIGEDKYADAGRIIIDHICEGMAPCGLLYPAWSRNKGWNTGWNPVPDWVQSRTIGEAILFILRAVENESARGTAHPNWEEIALDCCRKIVDSSREDGNLGSYYHVETGKVEVWDGAGGLIWIPALIKAGKMFNKPEFIETAKKAGDYYRQFVDDAFIYGAPEDVHLTPTSEDGYNAIMAYMALYGIDEQEKWLNTAMEAFEWTMTFRYLYNVTFTKDTILGFYDYRTVGGDMASPANLHIHNYGLICQKELLRLWEITRDPHIMDRLRDHLFCFLQFIARRDGDFGARRGLVTERWFTTDWDHAKGEQLALAHSWCEGMILNACLATSDYGDIVIDIDSSQVHLLEPLEMLSTDWSDGLRLELKNPYDEDIELKIALFSRKAPSLATVNGDSAPMETETGKTVFPARIKAGATLEIRCSRRD